ERPELRVPHAPSLVLEGMPGDKESTEDGPGGRTRLAIALIDELVGGLRRFIQLGGAPQSVLPRYRQVVLTLGTKVVVHLPDGTTTHGVARDVAGTGALVVDVDGGGAVVVASGYFSHLRPEEGESWWHLGKLPSSQASGLSSSCVHIAAPCSSPCWICCISPGGLGR